MMRKKPILMKNFKKGETMKKLILFLMIGMLFTVNLFAASSVHSYELSVIDGHTSDYYIWGDSIFIEGSAADPDTTFITNFFEIGDYSEKTLQIFHSTGIKDSIQIYYQPLVQKADTLSGAAANGWIYKTSILKADESMTSIDLSGDLKGYQYVRFRIIDAEVDGTDADCGAIVRFIANNPNNW
jgi:hypothetical protein